MRATVVGAGPNGMAAAAYLSAHGVDVVVLEATDRIGGGSRSGESTLPGLLHDDCAGVHPLGPSSHELSALIGDQVRWRRAPIDLAHPLHGEHGSSFVRSIDETAAGLGEDGRRWRRLFSDFSERFDELAQDILHPVLKVPVHPILLARFGVRSLLPASQVVQYFRTESARALFAGAAAHAFRPFSSVSSAAIGFTLLTAGHHNGWPVAEGGSQRIIDALQQVLVTHGGTTETATPVNSMRDLPVSDVTLFDLTPAKVADILGPELPSGVRRAYTRWRSGPAVFKLDLAVQGGIPWSHSASRSAGTVHVGGSAAEIAIAEREVVRGRLPDNPFVLVTQQYLADPSRSHDDVHPVLAYAHVPFGYQGDLTSLVIRQLERFAPGVSERILAVSKKDPSQLEAYNANFVGGDIVNGANTVRQTLFRPRVTLDPYRVGRSKYFLCSAATPPGAGAHGLCGLNAAKSALAVLERQD